MRANEMKSRWGAAIAGTLGAGALLVTVGCGATRDLAAGNTAQMPTANQAGAPILVSCEPHQRALVRPAVVNGAAVSQVECVTAAMTDAYASGAIAQPVANAALPAYRVASAPRQVVYDELGDTQIVPVASRSTVRPVRTRQVVYDERVQEVDGQDSAPDAGDPLDEPVVAGEDVDREDEEHHGDEDGEVLQECHALVSTVPCLALEPLFLGGGLAIACGVVGTTSHCDASFRDLN